MRICDLAAHQEDVCIDRERPCPQADRGCEEFVPAGELAKHLKESCVVTLRRDEMADRARNARSLVRCAVLCCAVLCCAVLC